ncbi:hypothetical protein LDY77_25415 [Serratia marcescens]|uniref:hypothetical protein n=1 Tax=Serratia marcescens TaxID=615 RepID=UPI001CDD23ED|nr:hypothetical protein [Serratia marcescens]MCA4113856.1 hypothetical protein [Serratia marcescens]
MDQFQDRKIYFWLVKYYSKRCVDSYAKEHAIYNEMMESKLDALERVANKEKWDYRRIQNEVLNLQHEARKGFKTGKLTCA